jgi:hypothetical protein
MKIHWNMKERSHADSEAWAVRLRQTSEIYGNLTSDIFGQKVDSNMWGLVCYKRQCDACLLFCWNWHLFLPFLAFAFCRVELIPEHLLGPRPRKWAGATAWYGHSDMHGQRIYKNKNTSSAQPCRGGSLKTKRWCIRNHRPTGHDCEMSKQRKWWLRGASMIEQMVFEMPMKWHQRERNYWHERTRTQMNEWMNEYMSELMKLHVMTWHERHEMKWIKWMKWHDMTWHEMKWNEWTEWNEWNEWIEWNEWNIMK